MTYESLSAEEKAQANIAYSNLYHTLRKAIGQFTQLKEKQTAPRLIWQEGKWELHSASIFLASNEQLIGWLKCTPHEDGNAWFRSVPTGIKAGDFAEYLHVLHQVQILLDCVNGLTS